MFDREDDFVPFHKRQRASDFKVAPTPITPTAKPSPNGIGSHESRCYCHCGAKKRDGRCIRGCEA